MSMINLEQYYEMQDDPEAQWVIYDYNLIMGWASLELYIFTPWLIPFNLWRRHIDRMSGTTKVFSSSNHWATSRLGTRLSLNTIYKSTNKAQFWSHHHNLTDI